MPVNGLLGLTLELCRGRCVVPDEGLEAENIEVGDGEHGAVESGRGPGLLHVQAQRVDQLYCRKLVQVLGRKKYCKVIG